MSSASFFIVPAQIASESALSEAILSEAWGSQTGLALEEIGSALVLSGIHDDAFSAQIWGYQTAAQQGDFITQKKMLRQIALGASHYYRNILPHLALRNFGTQRFGTPEDVRKQLLILFRPPPTTDTQVMVDSHNGPIQENPRQGITASANIPRAHKRSEHLTHALSIEEKIGSDNANARWRAIDELHRIIPHLTKAERLELVLVLERRLENDDVSTRKVVITLLGKIIPELAESDMLIHAIEVEKRLGSDDSGECNTVFTAIDTIAQFLTQSDVLKLALLVARRLESDNPDELFEVERMLPNIMRHLPESDKIIVAKVVMGRNPWFGMSGHLFTLDGLTSFFPHHETRCEDFIRWARGTLTRLGIDAKYADCIYADMQRRDTGLMLFSEIIRQSVNNPVALEAAFNRGPGAFSRYLFTTRTGIVIEGFENGKYREKVLGDLYETALSLNGEVPLHISGTIARDRDLHSVRNLIVTINRLHGILGRNTAQVATVLIVALANGRHVEVTDRASAFRFAKSESAESKTPIAQITAENLENTLQGINKIFIEIFKDVFKVGNRGVTMEDINALEKKWGNLDVLFTLVARFEQKLGWRKEVPVLGRVAHAVLENRFAELKYEGMDGDTEDQAKTKAQTAMLKTPEQRAGWQRDFSRIGLHNKISGGPTPEQNLAKSQELLRSQAMRHAYETAGGKIDRSEIDRIKRELQEKGFKLETLKGLRAYKRGHLLIATLEIALSATDLAEYLKVITFIRGNDGIFRLSGELRENLKDLNDIARAQVKSEEAIVFTTTTADPKLLLMTGVLVGVTSCQNYRTGSHIETLLGYVMDANVELMLTYTLTRRNFESDAEFEMAKRLVSEKVPVEFNAAKQMLKIGDIEIELPQAVNRHIIKLGATDNGEAGITLEKAFAQPHAAEKLMREQIGEVFTEQAKESGAVTNQKITIPPSRNPGGVYSDASGGVKIDGYIIMP